MDTSEDSDIDTCKVKRDLDQKGYWKLFSEGNGYQAQVRELENIDINNHWPKYNDLKVIVIGSSPSRNVPNFKSSGAFVGTNAVDPMLPRAVKNLKESLNGAFQNLSEESFDSEAMHSKEAHGILFINIFPREAKPETSTGEFFVDFLNRILRDKRNEGKKLMVLDMRLDKDRNWLECLNLEYGNIDLDGLKLQNADKFHQHEILSHPAYPECPRYPDSTILRNLARSQREIESIYAKEGACSVCSVGRGGLDPLQDLPLR